MWRYALGGVVLALIAVEIPSMLDRATKQNGSVQHENTSVEATKPSRDGNRQQTTKVTYPTRENHNPLEGRVAKIKSDRRGHFVTSARLNGRRANVLVDTGATAVAINRSTARRIGLSLKAADFKYTVNTANGRAKAAVSVIKEIEIGRVRVKNVRTTIMEDRALDTILLGMTFLNELKKFEVSHGTLVLTQ